MQNAKRMVLVDEKFLEEFYRKENHKWKRPIDIRVKSTLDRQMKSKLDDDVIADDVKVKLYNRDLSRYLNTRKKLPDEFPVNEQLKKEQYIEEVKQQKEEEKQQQQKEEVKQQKEEVLETDDVKKTDTPKRKRKLSAFPSWRRERTVKIPKKLSWENW